jgi:hypothetical protein
MTDQLKPPERFRMHFTAANGSLATVDVAVYGTLPFRVVVAWNPEGDEGPSVTNTAEVLWSKIVMRLHATTATTLVTALARGGFGIRFVEDYPFSDDEIARYDEVRFGGFSVDGDVFAYPRWTHRGPTGLATMLAEAGC